jgi:glutamate/tyrosine decarboxylase-like PLP-dependent enzyme
MLAEVKPSRMTTERHEETLDPETTAQWAELGALGRRMVDDSLDWVRSVRQRPVWRPLPPALPATFQAEVPRAGQAAGRTYEEFLERIRPYPTGNVHPRFWGWVMNPGSPVAAFADYLASTMNPMLLGYADAPALVEDQVIAWWKELLGFPASASGLLVSGGSTANLVALTAARGRAAPDVARDGMKGAPAMKVYASTETHACVQRALEVLGLGAAALESLPVGPDRRVLVDAMAEAIARDRREGKLPLAIVGNAGTVATGAIDDLQALADLAERERIWFHVDGAIGAVARISPGLRPRLEGLERADSVAFDLHKWLYVPYECACVLVRDAESHRRAFVHDASYVAPLERGPASRGHRYSDHGIQLSRGFRALKVWMTMKTYGVDKLARLIEQNVAQARHLAARIDAEPCLERETSSDLNIVCFRWRGSDDRNRELLFRIQESGFAVPSHVVLDGRFWLRVCIVNHRTTRADLDAFVDEVLRVGRAPRPAIDGEDVSAACRP